MKLGRAYALVALLALCSCSQSTHLERSASFPDRLHRVAVLPLRAHNDSAVYADYYVAGQLTEALIEQGITVIDASALHVDPTQPDSLLISSLRDRMTELRLDGVFAGTTEYHMDGPSSISTTHEGWWLVDLFSALFSVLLGDGNDKDRTDTVHSSLPGSHSSTGGYRLHRAQIYFIESRHGEIALTANSDSVSVGEMIGRIQGQIK